MRDDTKFQYKNKQSIGAAESTDERITSRDGLAFFARYLKGIQLNPICWFDHLKRDEGYAALLATNEQHLASSHSVKRFFDRFSFLRIYVFRQLLQRLFIWMLRQTNRSVIEFCIDTIVLNNDDARKRHGVQPTYKKDKGFHPLQMNWGRYMVDAVFREAGRTRIIVIR